MSYSDEKYGGTNGIDYLNNRYAEQENTYKSQDNQRKRENKADSAQQLAAQVAASELAKNNDVERTQRSSQNALGIKNQDNNQQAVAESVSRRLQQNIEQDRVNVDNKFKSSESALDRGKSADEFTQNRYQLKQNQAQDRANLEYSTAQGLAKDKQSQDAELARVRASGEVSRMLAERNNASAANLANISQQTELAGQASAVERAKLTAQAQVRAALFSPRSYQGY